MMIKSKMLINHVHLSDIKIIYRILKYNYGQLACSLNLRAIKDKQKTFYFTFKNKIMDFILQNHNIALIPPYNKKYKMLLLKVDV